ncbi:hypothetical protein LEP1GSC137_0232 [Leptospira borgpetersenii str. Noumea 25]|uniref:Uncharacterized protein n=3 Tax=Leptospira borgpetersenii TaxID=174 RepID=M3F873_LEPBO|nr:hypothetical protein LBBP_04121 [Leptospira borgpetersenii serovar Ballum]EKP11694.1 hypothetical protein LEP1GSC128_1180 [Leptospira borgpetersenii str. 200801926]EKR01004.1 hypothetical protein LEP1GSC121_1533 [Leptospira borgpetersenii serovar Castellonis str. 200801910]EMF98097.1 hypothetical protein LEP1GSC123_1122 [Leptospira borgpetersenii str. 200701203]EMO10115.1 hypothetical protein LEP1GSC137_0232 [Leptospira borgpetersenii str. Noumea 25]ENO63054.1 hypothetical protein LEP1GSC19
MEKNRVFTIYLFNGRAQKLTSKKTISKLLASSFIITKM